MPPTCGRPAWCVQPCVLLLLVFANQLPAHPSESTCHRCACRQPAMAAFTRQSPLQRHWSCAMAG